MKNLIIALILITTTGYSKELQKVSLQLHWRYQFEFAGFIAAKEKGFYKEAGLDVELKELLHEIDIPKKMKYYNLILSLCQILRLFYFFVKFSLIMIYLVNLNHFYPKISFYH